jgi:uncharacterized membrane protein YeiH
MMALSPVGQFTIPVYLDYFATFVWALSGAVVGAHRGYDIVGVFVIALVSSTGGGMLRDGFLLQRTPVLLTNGSYLVLIALATAVIAIAARWLMVVPKWAWSNKLIELIDAIGVPAALGTIALFFVVRALTIRFNWQNVPMLRQPPQ